MPPLKVHSFRLELTLSLSISMLVKAREKKLIMSTNIFCWSQGLLRSHSGISIKWASLVHDKSICFIERVLQKPEIFKSKHEIYYLSWRSKSRFIGKTKTDPQKKGLSYSQPQQVVNRYFWKFSHCDLVWAGERNRTPFIDRTEYYNFSWWFV